MNFEQYCLDHKIWSERTFGPATPENDRTKGVIKHIRDELLECAQAPGDAEEWADVIILAIDGAWRNGVGPRALGDALLAKQVKNENRVWPDWRQAPPDEPVGHVRAEGEAPPAKDDETAEQMLAMFEGAGDGDSKLPRRVINFMRNFYLWGVGLPISQARTLCLIMIRVVAEYKRGGRKLHELSAQEVDPNAQPH